MGHDVTRLGTAAIKRRYPPGMVPGQQLEEITLVQSDIEGSTEIWEWYNALHSCICLVTNTPAPSQSSCIEAQISCISFGATAACSTQKFCHKRHLLHGTFS